MRWASLLTIALLTPVLAASPTVEKSATAWTLRQGACSLSVSLADSLCTFRSPAAEFTITPSLQLGDGWTKSLASGPAPRVTTLRGQTTLTVTRDVPEDRQLVTVVTAYDGLPAIFVTTKLRVLTGTKSQYYFLQTSLPCDQYLTVGAAGPATVTLDKTVWRSLPWQPWWYLPRDRGGVAILPTNAAGTAPGQGSPLFLHALPKGAQLSVGDSLDASFGLASVADASAAAALYEQARSRQVAALAPWLRPDEKVDYGQPAPQWLRDAEVYNLYYRNAAQWTDEVVSTKLKGFPLIVGSTPDPTALERCHRQGIKLLHYVVYTCLLDTALQVKEGGQVYSEWTESVDNESRDLKNHPDWVCLDKDGKPQHDAWGMEHGHKGLLNTCLHQRGLREAAVRQVRILMERGYDGVFIDLAGTTVECYGNKLGKHHHEHLEWTNTQAYEELLKAIYTEAKRFGNDRIVMQNTCTGIIQSHWASCDSQMLEAVPYAAGSTTLRMTRPELLWTTLRLADAVKAGKVPVILPYFGGVTDLEAVKSAALTSHAWARLSGFLWADGFTLQDCKGLEDFSRDLYLRRTGKPTGPLTFDEKGVRGPFKETVLRLDFPSN